MLHRMRCLVPTGVQDSPRAAAKRVTPASWRADAASAAAGAGAGDKGKVCFRPPDVMETVHEVAIYIHRFHNLDLFQQGWYQMKISAMWEDSGSKTPASPARVVQYEALSRNLLYLFKGPAASSVMLKFELIYAPTLDSGSELQSSSATSSAAVHEFRIPRRALLGLHTYCPVHFDAFHSVLVDLTLHIVYLKAGATKASLKIPDQGLGPTSYNIVKALLTSRKMLLEELNKVSDAIGKTVEDLDGADLNLGKYESVNPSKSGLPNSSKVFPATAKGVGHLAGILHDFLERPNNAINGTDDSMLYTLPQEELFELFLTINTQSVQDMHMYADPSRVPVVLIEQHVMVVPQHGSSKDMASDASEQKDTIVLPKLQGEPLALKSSAGKKGGRILRAVIFVHGFQGHHLDLRLVRNQWLLLDPGADCLMSEANEDKTSGDFKEMGSRLAGEVVSFLKKKVDKLSKYGGCKELKLSFVGHSIGNIIIRSALAEPALQPYLKNLYTSREHNASINSLSVMIKIPRIHIFISFARCRMNRMYDNWVVQVAASV
ncbi:hypothetical protein PR202_gb00447 [Eleusine coracana subsp. coracana]|uniref:DUF676 domain-containing protein n=1 Tax=Eleusine coracana subsp. coracana TaxID=191504 RepID=A0AAV5DTQ0_ELECO|nr:hypothetical protein PR202_gb00447 [Eleusine coracana subsp. coracana]